MSLSYTVQAGDTLLKIAVEKNVDFATLLDLNPRYQSNPDLIHIGDTLVLPKDKEAEPIEPSYPVEPVSEVRELQDNQPLISPPLCQPIDVHDIIFLTGDGPLEYWLLDEKAALELEKESQQTNLLLNNYKTLLAKVPQGDTATPEALELHAREKEAWLKDAQYAGMFATAGTTQSRATKRVAQVAAAKPLANSNQARVNSELKLLRDRQRFVENYRNRWFAERSMEVLRQQVLAEIESDIQSYTALETKSAQAKPPVLTTKLGVPLKNLNSDGKRLTTRRISRHVVESYSVKHSKFVYMRSKFFEREERRWQRNYHHTSAMKALEQRDFKGFGKAIAKDIIEDNKSLKIQNKLAGWTAEGGKFVEWKATQPYLNDEGETVFAVSAEAQLFRWGAQASVATTFEPSKGKIDLGVGADASVSLAEAKAEAHLFLPCEAGYPIKLTYRDAKGKDATYSFGSFRFKGTVSVGCFAGVAVGASAQVGQAEEENGSSVGVMFTPHVDLSKGPKGEIGLRAQGFAGLQASGQLAGSMEWKAPEEDKPTTFKVLLKLSTSGNIAAGAGFGADFQLSLVEGKFYLKCSGQLVWGAGGGGGFGALIDMVQLWELAKVIFRGLQYIDYRVLANLNEKAYEYMVNSTLIAFSRDLIDDPTQTFEKVLAAGESKVNDWKDDINATRDRKHKATVLANRILDESTLSGVPFSQVLPEAIGVMLDTLVEEFLLSFNEQQEWAICKLLKESTYSWHKFEEILQRMNSAGEKQTGDKVMFDNLDRINAILDEAQQRMFNRWVTQLAHKNRLTDNADPYLPVSGEQLSRKRAQITARSDEYLPYR